MTKNPLELAEDYRLAGEYDAAKAGYDAIISDTQTTPLLKAHALRGMAEVHRMLEAYTTAIEFYNQAGQAYKTLNLDQGLGYTNLGMGQLNRQENHIEAAKKNIESAIDYFTLCSDSLGLADATLEKGHLAMANFDYVLAKNCFNQGYQTYKEVNDSWGCASAQLGAGKAALKCQETTLAKQHLSEALTLFIKLNDKLGQANAHKQLGNLHQESNQVDNAQTHFRAAVGLFEQMSEHSLAQTIKTQLINP